MAEINPELIQNIEEANKKWLPGFAGIANKFFNSRDAITVIAKGDDAIKGEAHRVVAFRVVAFRTDNFDCRLRTVRWGENLRLRVGDRVTLEWMQRFSPQDYQNGLLPRWGFITVGYSKNNVTVLAEELPNAGMRDLESWNNGKAVMEIAELEYPVKMDDQFDSSAKNDMSSADITKILLESRYGKVNNLITGDMVDDLMEGRNAFRKTANSTLGINIPVSLSQSIKI